MGQALNGTDTLDWGSLSRSLEWRRRPLQAEDQGLLGSTMYWLDALPRGARPLQLPRQFPRIANELCRLWWQPAALDFCLWRHRADDRGDRQGFPPLVVEELAALHRYVAQRDAPGAPDTAQPSPEPCPSQSSLMAVPMQQWA